MTRAYIVLRPEGRASIIETNAGTFLRWKDKGMTSEPQGYIEG